ncbi:MAG: response regulator [Deltaproteobacteria bacterium]|nr:response regulator [Deltaproteobacteria bacterium]
MNWVSISVPVMLMASVCFYVALYHFWMFLKRPKQRINLTFSIICVVVGCYDIFSAGLYNSQTLADGMFWQRLQMASLTLLSITIGWFIYYFVEYRTKKPFIIISGYFTVFLLMGLFVRNEWTLTLDNPAPKHLTLGGLLDVTYQEVDLGAIYLMQLISMAVGFLYLLTLLYLHYRRDEDKTARPILIAFCIYFASTVSDSLVAAGIYPFVYTAEYVFMFIILTMAYVLVNAFVELHTRIERLNAGLEKKVIERTAELHTMAEAAQEASAAKSEFLANMSHEIRTPINGVLGMTELLSLTELSNEQKEYLDVVSSSGKALLSIINDILDYSKIQSGQLSLEPHPFDLERLVVDVSRMLSFRANENDVQLQCDYPADASKYFIGDSVRVRQVLTNLVGNAVKFTHEGHVKIVATIDEGQDEAVITLGVEDTGIGIEADTLEHIFDRFTQADGSTTRKFGGTGLGLAISRQLVELMGGDLSVSSSKGDGTRFWFTISMPRCSRADVDQDLLSRTSMPPPPDDAKKTSVLLVEDNKFNQVVATRMLEKLGCSVEVADDGRIALEMIERDFQLIFMDCQMPVMDGYEATRRIREKEGAGLRRPIVAMTANAMAGDKERCFEAGMDGYLSKPISIEGILAVLEKHL